MSMNESLSFSLSLKHAKSLSVGIVIQSFIPFYVHNSESLLVGLYTSLSGMKTLSAHLILPPVL